MVCTFGKLLKPLGCVEFPIRWHPHNSKLDVCIHASQFTRRRRNGVLQNSRITAWSKRAPSQDFQVFENPSRLLPTTHANTYTKPLPTSILTSLESDISSSFYLVELRTSQDFGSSLKGINAAILLCLIDANGDSVLERLTTVSMGHPADGESIVSDETIHFQRGSVDVVTFKGPKLGEIEALWIGLESGSWRFDGVQVTVINGPITLLEDSCESLDNNQVTSFQYIFEANNILLGGGGDISMVEIRPVLVRKLSQDDLLGFLNTQSLQPFSMLTDETKKEDGMREYTDLKFSLLVYDSLLVLCGSVFLASSLDEKAAFGFFIGGIVGFLYLLQLQRSVDGLPVPRTTSESDEKEKSVTDVEGFKRPWITLALLILASAIALRYQTGSSGVVALTPIELFSAIGGFLTSKIAVIWAAYRPITRNLKIGDD